MSASASDPTPDIVKQLPSGSLRPASARSTGLVEPVAKDPDELTPAQQEYQRSLRISVRQMQAGEGRPLSDLLAELDVEPAGHDQTLPDD